MSAAPVDTIITDADGRKLRVVGLSIVEQYRLFKAIGSDAATNVINASMAQCAAAVREVDGVPLPYPITENGIELNLSRIGDAGYAAYFEWMRTETAREITAAVAASAEEKAGPLDTSGGSSTTPA